MLRDPSAAQCFYTVPGPRFLRFPEKCENIVLQTISGASPDPAARKCKMELRFQWKWTRNALLETIWHCKNLGVVESAKPYIG